MPPNNRFQGTGPGLRARPAAESGRSAASAHQNESRPTNVGSSMPSSADLSPRQRAGFVVAITALGVALNPLNRQFGVWLRDEVVSGVPFWLDHIAFMLTLMLVV